MSFIKRAWFFIKRYWKVAIIVIIGAAIWIFSSRHTSRLYRLQKAQDERERAIRELQESLEREKDRDAAHAQWAQNRIDIEKEHLEILEKEEERLSELKDELKNKDAHELVNTLSYIIERQRRTSGK